MTKSAWYLLWRLPLTAIAFYALWKHGIIGLDGFWPTINLFAYLFFGVIHYANAIKGSSGHA